MTTISKPNPELPTFEARDIAGVWDITMRIPHKAYGGDTIERILTINENAGAAPAEETIARRVCALLNMSAHIDTEDLFIKGATLKLQTFSERMAEQSGCQDVEQDLRDTCESLRRALKAIGLKFGIKSSDPQLIADAVTEQSDKMNADYSQVDKLLTERTNALANANMELADCKTILHDIRTSLEADPDYEYGDLPAITAELFTNLNQSREANKETAGQLAKADQELAQARGELSEAHRALKEIQRVLGVTVEHPKELPALVTKLANDLTSVRSSQTTLDPFKREVMALCMMGQSCPDMLPSLPELLIGIRDYVNTMTRYRGGAMLLHDRLCELVEWDSPATNVEPYAHHPWEVLADRLEEKFNAPRNAIATLIGNYELEVKDDWRDNVTELYTFLKGLSVAQHKHDEQLRTLLTERAVDRSIIGAIDDVLGDTSRPAAPLVAAVRALVRSHLIAIERS